ncbi:hypothetical protein [Microbacterium sp. YY-01]|uniref:hypothetical protein n=1 Tax=Microbacterium sp. YY-01 TaxID=3421634 RepID=UPI003D16A12D
MTTASAPGFRRDSSTVALAAMGVVAVIAGGLVAAVTDPLEVYRGSWMAAYLVLVVGVAQVSMAIARWLWPTERSTITLGWAQLVLWNSGNATIIAGTLLASPCAVIAGSVLLVAAVAIALMVTRWRRQRGIRGLWLFVFRAFMVVLVVSIPVGVILSTLRHSA